MEGGLRIANSANPTGDYRAFLQGKRLVAPATGFSVPDGSLSPALFPFQRDIVRWTCERGKAAIWADTGLGKTLMQLEWARMVTTATAGDVLILAPLAVTHQTVREGERFGIHVTPCRSQDDVRHGVNITNYEMLEHFNAHHFAGVVLDESAILRNYMGVTKRSLIESFSETPYRLCCTATPAPNDHIELGNHAEFLGVMPSSEMLSRWFINDTSRTGTYRLRGHAERDFWDWIASWAVSLRRPSDLGYSDEGFILPPLRLHQVDVRVDLTESRGEHLFRMPVLNATELHREMRLTAPARAEAVAERVNTDRETWLLFCNTNYEADALTARIPDAVEVRGSESPVEKERKLLSFIDGDIRVLVSKPRIAGLGLNFQHCHRMAFVGLSYSFVDLYQAIRRCYRYRQEQPVDAYLIVAETEGEILHVVEEKMAAHEVMLDAMTASTRRLVLGQDRQLEAYDPREPMQVPAWLHSESEEAA